MRSADAPAKSPKDFGRLLVFDDEDGRLTASTVRDQRAAQRTQARELRSALRSRTDELAACKAQLDALRGQPAAQAEPAASPAKKRGRAPGDEGAGEEADGRERTGRVDPGIPGCEGPAAEGKAGSA